MFELHNLKLKQFRQLMEEKIGLNWEMNKYDAQQIMQTDPRYKTLQDKDREDMYTNYMKEVFERMDIEFNQFLNETPIITKDSPSEGEEYKEIIKQLNSDVRCSRLSKFPDRRDKMIRARIKTLRNAFDRERKEKLKNDRNSKKNKPDNINNEYE